MPRSSVAVDGLLAAMHRHRHRAGALADAIVHFRKVARSYRPGLFHCYAVSGLPRTNNDLEQLFGHSATMSAGRVAQGGLACDRVARRGAPDCSYRDALRPIGARELGEASRAAWRDLRHRLKRRRHAQLCSSRSVATRMPTWPTSNSNSAS